jgi:hypothetical protein
VVDSLTRSRCSVSFPREINILTMMTPLDFGPSVPLGEERASREYPVAFLVVARNHSAILRFEYISEFYIRVDLSAAGCAGEAIRSGTLDSARTLIAGWSIHLRDLISPHICAGSFKPHRRSRSPGSYQCRIHDDCAGSCRYSLSHIASVPKVAGGRIAMLTGRMSSPVKLLNHLPILAIREDWEDYLSILPQ